MDKSTVLISITAVALIIVITIFVGRPDSPTTLPTTLPPVTASVVANGVKDVSGIQFDISYNPNVVQYNGVSEGTLLDEGASESAMLLPTAVVEGNVVKNFVLLRVVQPGVDGSGTLASVQFRRIGPGSPDLALRNVLVSDSKGKPVNGELISIVTQ